MNASSGTVNTYKPLQTHVLTLRMSHLVKREANPLFMQRFPDQISSRRRNVVVLFAKDLHRYQMGAPCRQTPTCDALTHHDKLPFNLARPLQAIIPTRA